MRERFIPPGRQDGQPSVSVARQTVRLLGEPKVEYSLLNQLVTEEFHLPTGEDLRLRLFGASTWGLPSFYLPTAKTLYLNAVKAENKRRRDPEADPFPLVEELIESGQKFADAQQNGKIRTYGIYLSLVLAQEVGLHLALGKEIENLPPYLRLPTEMLLIFLARGIKNALRPDPTDDEELQRRERIKKYQEAIVFPAS